MHCCAPDVNKFCRIGSKTPEFSEPSELSEFSGPLPIMPIAHINIGSNIGDRRAALARAVAAVESTFGASARLSDIIESAPWGYHSDNAFLNLGLEIETGALPPLEVLRRLHEAQRSVSTTPHRRPDGSYADRVIDIDLIAIGDCVVDTPELTLPHPRMHLRRFVLVPMMQLSPAWRHPLTGLTAAEMAAMLPPGE